MTTSIHKSNVLYFIVANFLTIDQAVAKIRRFNGFSKWRPFAVLEFLNLNFPYPKSININRS